MPRVKIDYVVSFSSEDPDNPASNLLAWEISKKKWLCAKGESGLDLVSCRTRMISQVDIGAYNTALVEVLVGRSERLNDPFEVLVPRCVLLTPAQSRKGDGEARVRSFAASALSAARAHRWDRVRVVCSQPYNHHCQFGLSFVHIFESEATAPGGEASVPAGRGAGRDALALAGDDDDEDFRPGELFAQHRARAATTVAPTTAATATTTTTGAGTDAQIRQVTSRALKNMEDSSTKIVKAPISRTGGGGKIRNDEDKEKRETSTDGRRRGPAVSEGGGRARAGGGELQRGQREAERDEGGAELGTDVGTDMQAEEHRQGEGAVSGAAARGRKRKRSDERERSLSARRAVALRGAAVALSGFQHPERGRLRELALAMGARYHRDCGPTTTHLVCAFPNTPKLRALRAAGGAGVAVQAGWLRACWRRARQLPWRPHAAAPAERTAHTHSPHSHSHSDDGGGAAPECDEECDTDDEIEKVLREKRRRASSPRGDDDGALTEAESPPRASPAPRPPLPALPAPLAGRVLAVDAALPGCERGRLVRYIRAYGGHVAQDGAEPAAAAECVVTSRARGPRSPPHVPPRRLLALLAAHATRH